ncbi:MAG: YeeE/YedE thiosulfate transporter family protein [Phycisphaerales bacterium]
MNTLTLASAWIDSPNKVIMGALAGLVFGFLLQRGSVTRFGTIVDQLRLKDFTVLKVMLTAIVVGGIGIYAMRAMGMDIPLHIKGTKILGVALGGGIFGIGMATLGYCPGTVVAAIGDGSRHAWFGVLGMFIGAVVYIQTYPMIKEPILSKGDLGKVTLASELHWQPLLAFVPVTILALALFFILEKWARPKNA